MKLAGSLGDKLRNMSSLWVPPIYRRLVSLDKRDRDMSERCLLKIMPILCPPQVTLSKVVNQFNFLLPPPGTSPQPFFPEGSLKMPIKYPLISWDSNMQMHYVFRPEDFVFSGPCRGFLFLLSLFPLVFKGVQRLL